MQVGWGGCFKSKDPNKWLIWKNWIEWLGDVIEVDKEYYELSFKPYPLQIANAIRIMTNDAVYIFDEVGCGKTISAGIMAKTYLSKYPQKDVLVITTNTIKINQQFKEDWNKIDIHLFDHVTVYNNLFNSDLKTLTEDKRWGLVIIDEAHEFSNTDTQKYKALKDNLRAEKVVFLTATPLRGGKNGFWFYKELTKSILGKEIDLSALDHFDEADRDQELICAKFDPTFPITRYFKDTVKYLDIHERKERAHRVVPEIWKINNETFVGRETILVEGLKRKLKENVDSKFVIFTRFKKEAESLKAKIVQSGVEQLSDSKVEVIFSASKDKLIAYGKISCNLPTVLIINYQIGEAGVNLPGYDHVIHWHISSAPARLEQRYGRIDRLTSKAEKIYSVFVDSPQWDTNQSNFMDAIRYTMGDLLTTLPARNVLLTRETLDYYKYIIKFNHQKSIDELIDCRNFLLDANDADKKKEMIRKCFDADEQSMIIPDEQSWKNAYKIIQGIIEKRQEFDWTEEQLFEELRAILEKRIEIKSNKLIEEVAEKFSECIETIEKESDKIFYMTESFNPEKLRTIGAQGEENGCASKIETQPQYVMLRDLIKLMESTAIVKAYAYEDIAYATDMICQIGEMSFGEDWRNGNFTETINGLRYRNIK